MDGRSVRILLATSIGAMVIGVLVYIFDRQPDSVYLLPDLISSANHHGSIFGHIGNYLPTFIHSYVFILLTALVINLSKCRIIIVCVTWFAVESLFEIGQITAIANWISINTPHWFSGIPLLENVSNYFVSGTFDLRDLISIALGTVAAYITLLFGSKVTGNSHPNDTQHNLRRLLAPLGISLLGISTILGSGGGEGSNDGNNSVPFINNLEYSPQTAFLNDGNGSITLNGTIDFEDPDGDISTYELTIVDSSQNLIGTLSNPIPGVNGIINGTLFLSALVNTTIVDEYGFSVHLIDMNGNESNVLSGVFPIIGPIQTTSNIPETGINRCYNQSSIINCPTSSNDPFYGQDFHYVSNPMNFTNNGNGTITDNVTSLMWQMNTDGVTYNWFESSGTFDATNNPGSINACGDLSLDGYNDWRLPEKRELASIVDYGITSPSINTTYFTDTVTRNYWSATEFDSATAWYGNFNDGSINQSDKAAALNIRCVRGLTWGNTDFIDNGDGTISDIISGLMWQKTGQNNSYNWEEMLGFCTGLSLAGYNDWRLPDIKELESIVGGETYLNLQQGIYCSASTIIDDSRSVWLLQLNTLGYGTIFKHGAGYIKDVCSSFYSICVR